jgi:hypothetical protein
MDDHFRTFQAARKLIQVDGLHFKKGLFSQDNVLNEKTYLTEQDNKGSGYCY